MNAYGGLNMFFNVLSDLRAVIKHSKLIMQVWDQQFYSVGPLAVWPFQERSFALLVAIVIFNIIVITHLTFLVSLLGKKKKHANIKYVIFFPLFSPVASIHTSSSRLLSHVRSFPDDTKAVDIAETPVQSGTPTCWPPGAASSQGPLSTKCDLLPWASPRTRWIRVVTGHCSTEAAFLQGNCGGFDLFQEDAARQGHHWPRPGAVQ